MELLDAVEQYGYGNWSDVAKKVSGSQRLQRAQQRTPDETREEFGAAFVLGSVGASTWREDDRGRARDHTQGNPLLPPALASEAAAADGAPGLGLHETTMLGYMPLRRVLVAVQGGTSGLRRTG